MPKNTPRKKKMENNRKDKKDKAKINKKAVNDKKKK
ncbi:hypothetical protein NEF87_002454 [Candidatus Lokiarchaeum ossiferum]|uniref:Uncharacterized protein n=1 Tax=Candidatus Lokiarchaeum ossiferum TaxID=2951803 RepID=A0ABY6HUN9_9ARCH|nr:hypothetical protein NEF87_002454 [Candidatus Lokiarchaeum sp. B-35]